MAKTRIVATRKSALALWQTRHVETLLKAKVDCKIQELQITTAGDRFLDTPLVKLGGKGLFVKELDQALLEKRADYAVHSVKDIPMALADGLVLAAIMPREMPQDAWVSNTYDNIQSLPAGAVVGTASIRRTCQLVSSRPDLRVEVCRGNVNTRLQKLDDGLYDGIILAASGLKRLGFEGRIRDKLPMSQFLPAAGQGAVGVVCRASDLPMREELAALNCLATEQAVIAERAVSRTLDGSCQTPLAAHATIENDRLTIEAKLYHPEDASRCVVATQSGKASQADDLGIALAKHMAEEGADILSAIALRKV